MNTYEHLSMAGHKNRFTTLPPGSLLGGEAVEELTRKAVRHIGNSDDRAGQTRQRDGKDRRLPY